MWPDFWYWKDMFFQDMRFHARFHYGDPRTVLYSSLTVVRDDRDEIKARKDWFRDDVGS